MEWLLILEIGFGGQGFFGLVEFGDVGVLVMVWRSEVGVVDDGVLCYGFRFDVDDGVLIAQ